MYVLVYIYITATASVYDYNSCVARGDRDGSDRNLFLFLCVHFLARAVTLMRQLAEDPNAPPPQVCVRLAGVCVCVCVCVCVFMRVFVSASDISLSFHPTPPFLFPAKIRR